MTLEGSNGALPLIDMGPTPQMRETPSPDANDISIRFLRMENLVEMIAMYLDLVELVDMATTPEDPSAASESATPVGVQYLGDVDEHVNDQNEATTLMPPRKKRKLDESSGSKPDRGNNNDIFFLPSRSSLRTFLSMI